MLSSVLEDESSWDVDEDDVSSELSMVLRADIGLEGRTMVETPLSTIV